MLLGAGELGREVAIELMRLGVEVVACDRYQHAPAMQVAHRAHVFDMLDGGALRAVVMREQPHLIVPEIEAIATDTLLELEAEGFTVIPTARAARLTMDREGIRRLVAEQLGVPTSGYEFAGSIDEFRAAVRRIGLPCVVKPTMSSSGKGQSTVRREDEIDAAWEAAAAGARGASGRVIVEQFIDFDYEITLLTVRHIDGVSFCAPVGHRQEGGDYQESWQPQAMRPAALEACQHIAERVTGELGGRGIFGVEFFVAGDEVYFSELSPRPHDTGMVTMISQNLSEFALHARAILGLPIPRIELRGAAASAVLLVRGTSHDIAFDNLDAALAEPGTELRLFGKPEVTGHRRMGVALAMGETVDAARARAARVIEAIGVRL